MMRRYVGEFDPSSDFSIVRETCFGDNPYLKIQRDAYGTECKTCTRPFTVFRWKSGSGARYKKTEICQYCSKLKNVCQVCILDLEYGLPVQLRDTLLGNNSIIDTNSLPQNPINMLYSAQQTDGKLTSDYESSYGKTLAPNDTILKLQRSKPYYDRNRPHICSFNARAACTRGAECPYRHDMPITNEELSNQNIKDRFHGVNDPVALKTLRNLGKSKSHSSPEPPEDKSIRTLYVGGLDSSITEQDVRTYFYAHGEIESVRLVQQNSCAFVAYTTREAAEKAVKELSNKLVIKGLSLKLGWGRSNVPNTYVANQPAMAKSASSQQQIHYPNNPIYPSMDSQRMGSLIPTKLQPYAYPATSASSDYRQFFHQ